MVWLDNSRVLAICAVVLLHVSARTVHGCDIGTEYWWFGNIYDSAVRWSVPVFVMISGALLLDPNKQENLPTFYIKRLSRILVPLLFWSVFFLICTFLKSVVKGNELTIIDLLKRLLSGTPYPHMWFLYMILSLYLFTPFFRKIVAHSTKNELLFFIASTFIISSISYAYSACSPGGKKLFITSFLSYIPFFFIGYFIRQDTHYPSKVLLWCVFLISVILTFVGCYIITINTCFPSGFYIYRPLSVTVIPMSISLMYILKAWNKPILNVIFVRKLSILTLGVYLVHPIVLGIICYIEHRTINLHPAISIPAITLITFVVSTGIAHVIYKIPYLRRTI